MKDNNIKIKDKVMAEIKEKKVSLRSKYVYLVEKCGRYGGVLVFSLLAVLFFVLIFWYFNSTDNLLYLRFGRPGLVPFFQTFPYFFVAVLLALLCVTGLIIKKIFYKKPFGLLITVLILTVFIMGGALVAIGAHKKMESFALENRQNFMLQPFMHRGPGQNNRGIAGRVIEKNKNDFMVQDICGEQKVSWFDEKNKIGESDFTVGDFVVGIGEWREDGFYALAIKNVEKDRLKMVVGSDNNRLPPPLGHVPEQNGENWHPNACVNND